MNINEQFEIALSSEITEASKYLKYSDLLLAKLQARDKHGANSPEVKKKAEEVFDGIHGYIVLIRVSSVVTRHQSTTFEYLTKGPDYRWIEFDDKYIKIGF